MYPLNKDDDDLIHTRYLEFVNDVHQLDTPENKEKHYDVVFVDSALGNRWLERFVRKLEHVERFLDFFSKGGTNRIHIERDPNHDEMLMYIFKLLADNRRNTPEDDDIQLNIRNMIIDPHLCKEEIFQVRYNKTLLSWHKNFIYVIKK